MGIDSNPSRTDIPSEISSIGFGEILGGLDTPFIVFGPHGERLFANEAAARMLGFRSVREYMSVSHEAALQRLEFWDESRNPLEPGQLASRQALAGKTPPARMVGFRIKPSGPVQWALVKSTPVSGPDGRLRFVVNIMQDVTSVKEAQLDLARTRDDQAAMLRLMETGCTAMDPDGKLVYANAAAVRYLGYPDEASLLQSGDDVPDDRFELLDGAGHPLAPDRQPGRRALAGETVRGEIIGYKSRATGRDLWFMVNASPLFDAKGRVRLAINVFADITAMRQAQASVEKHMRYLEGMHRVSGAMQRAFDAEGSMQSVLARLLEVFDCDRTWLVQYSDAENRFRIPFAAGQAASGAPADVPGSEPGALPPEARFDEVAALCQDSEDPLVFGRAERPLPNPAFWKDGLGVGSLKAVCVRPQAGRPWILCLLRHPGAEPWKEEDFTMFKDISLRIATALGAMILYRDLRRSEEKHRTLFERSLDGIFRIAPDGVVLDANPAMVAMLGHADRTGLIGSRQPLLLPAGGDPGAHGDRGETFSVELSRQDSASVWVEVNAQPIRRRNGEIAYYEGIVRNITDRKRAEEALKASEEKLRQSQKMEAIGRLAGGVAHDFNNLLTAINGFSDLLLMSVDKDDPRRSHLEEIRKAGSRAAALTSQLLSFSRKQVLAPRLVDLNEAVQGMETMLRRLIGEDIRMSADLAPDLPKIVADPNQLEQVILNLVLNARDAMPEGGDLRILTGRRALREEERVRAVLDAPPGGYVMLSVRDTGTGMDAETRSRLFEPFFTTKPKDKGTGLGLSTVYGAVKQAGGTILVSSAPGWGSDFCIFLPEAPANAVDSASGNARELQRKTAGGTETILLVEDEDAVRRLARDVLASAGYTVFEAPGGEKALEVAERIGRNEIHLLLTDVVMGGMSGRELAERLERDRPGLRVLYMSGYTEDAIIRHGVYTARAAFIGKPFSPAALTAKVREVLDAITPK